MTDSQAKKFSLSRLIAASVEAIGNKLKEIIEFYVTHHKS